MHENVYVLLHAVTAFMFQYQNNIYEVTFMQLRDPTAFMFQECSSIYSYKHKLVFCYPFALCCENVT